MYTAGVCLASRFNLVQCGSLRLGLQKENSRSYMEHNLGFKNYKINVKKNYHLKIFFKFLRCFFMGLFNKCKQWMLTVFFFSALNVETITDTETLEII